MTETPLTAFTILFRLVPKSEGNRSTATIIPAAPDLLLYALTMKRHLASSRSILRYMNLLVYYGILSGDTLLRRSNSRFAIRCSGPSLPNFWRMQRVYYRMWFL